MAKVKVSARVFDVTKVEDAKKISDCITERAIEIEAFGGFNSIDQAVDTYGAQAVLGMINAAGAKFEKRNAAASVLQESENFLSARVVAKAIKNVAQMLGQDWSRAVSKEDKDKLGLELFSELTSNMLRKLREASLAVSAADDDEDSDDE